MVVGAPAPWRLWSLLIPVSICSSAAPSRTTTGAWGDSRFRREPKTGDLVGGQAQFTPFLVILLHARGPNFGVATGVLPMLEKLPAELRSPGAKKKRSLIGVLRTAFKVVSTLKLLFDGVEKLWKMTELWRAWIVDFFS